MLIFFIKLILTWSSDLLVFFLIIYNNVDPANYQEIIYYCERAIILVLGKNNGSMCQDWISDIYFYLSDFSYIHIHITFHLFAVLLVSHVLHRCDSRSLRVFSDYFTEIDCRRISLARFSQLYSRSMFAKCSLAWTTVGRIAVSQRRSFSRKPTRSLIDIRQTVKRWSFCYSVTSPSSESLSTMRHSFRLNAHAISRSFEAICRNRDIIIFLTEAASGSWFSHHIVHKHNAFCKYLCCSMYEQ